MLKKIVVFVILLIVGAVLFWLSVPRPPSIDTIKKIANVTVGAGTTIHAFERISDRREPEFVISLFIPEGGDRFCEINKLTKGEVSFSPLKPGEKGYNLLLGRPSLCSGVKSLGNGGVYIVVRQSEAVIYIDDR